MNTTNAVVIASATSDPQFAAVAPGGSKSLVEINGRASIGYLTEQLKGCEHVDRVIVVGCAAAIEATPHADVHVPAGSSDAQNVMAGIRAAEGSSRCLIMTGDMPIASSEAIADMLAYAPDADVVYPVVSREDVEDSYPLRSVSYLKTKDGQFTGSSLLLLKCGVASAKEDMLVSLLDARKDPKALLGLIGPMLAMKIALSTPSLTEFEGYLSKPLGLDCRVFVSHYPEMLMSMDSPEDVRFFGAELAP